MGSHDEVLNGLGSYKEHGGQMELSNKETTATNEFGE